MDTVLEVFFYIYNNTIYLERVDASTKSETTKLQDKLSELLPELILMSRIEVGLGRSLY